MNNMDRKPVIIINDLYFIFIQWPSGKIFGCEFGKSKSSQVTIRINGASIFKITSYGTNKKRQYRLIRSNTQIHLTRYIDKTHNNNHLVSHEN